jgi:hypothetical protein
LRKDNRSGICRYCRKGQTPARAELAHNRQIAASNPFVVAPPDAAPPSPPPGRLAVMVSEAQLDQYLTKLDFDWRHLVTKLPVEVKLALVNAVLLAESESA